MADRSGTEQPRGPLTPLRRRRRWVTWVGGFVGVRELLICAAAIGLVVGVSWADEQFECERIEQDQDQLAQRNAALDAFAAERCLAAGGESDGCEHVEVVSRNGCLAKLRVQARRVDDYGDEIGTFITIEGLTYSPLFERWRVREVLDDKQILGLPVP
ncbi:hypothetical protein DB30_01811 [Enhygromyxa salina]|uniref:Uncharacterized protein n=1 Tax=Enhygromyxa salina TaxID=215803 RepID=A0A0C2CWJ7_9BACT|nr:hypothetical protein [Enhygromyxa salina]KIG12207.1 hypothetical protein DB30_01811 [Enhygromyxa salina]